MLFSISAVDQQSFSEMATTNQQNSGIKRHRKWRRDFFFIKLDFWKQPIDLNMNENSNDFLFHFNFFSLNTFKHTI